MEQAPSVREGLDPPEASDCAGVYYPRSEVGPRRIRDLTAGLPVVFVIARDEEI